MILADMQSALEPAGTQAERIHKLLMLYTWVCVVVFAAVAFTFVGSKFQRSHDEAAAAGLT